MTTSAVAVRGAQGTALSFADGQTEFNQAQVATLRHMGVKNASREDLAVFFHQCSRTGLDPFARQIYMLERWTKDGPKQTIQTGIDGFRLVADRVAAKTGESYGFEDTLWCGEDGQWRDVWLSKTPPAAAKVTVIRNGNRFPAVALFEEYAGRFKDGNLNPMWASKGALMIAKCAEALALRKAFPQDLSGLYTSEEMQQSDNPAPGTRQRPREATVTAADFTRGQKPDPEPVEVVTGETVDGELYVSDETFQALGAALRDAGYTDDQQMTERAGTTNPRSLTEAQALELIDQLEVETNEKQEQA